MDKMPAWADAVLVPLISLLLAAVISALVILAIGENPVEALKLMVTGAMGSTYGWGFTLYYATNFLFTGLAFAVASHAGLFNIGSEGQAMVGGLGVALICLALPWPHWALALPAAIVGAALLEVIRNGLLMAGIDSNWQGAFVGVIIIVAVLIGIQTSGENVLSKLKNTILPRRDR